MRKVIKFFDIILISLAIFAFCVSNIVYNYTLNKNYIQKVLKDNKVYTTINDEIKTSVKTDLKVSISGIPNLDINELVDYTVKEDIIEKEVDFILTELYNNNKMRIDLSILTKGYSENLNKYIEEKKLDVPKEVKNEMNKVFESDSLQVQDVDVFNNNYAKYYVKGKTIIKQVKLYSLCALVGLVGLTLLLARKKASGIYIPALLSAGMLYAGGYALKTFLDTQDIKIGDKKLDNIVTSIKNGLFDTINKYAIVLVIIAVLAIIASIIWKLIRGKKKEEPTTGGELSPEKEEEIKKIVENDVPPYYQDEKPPVNMEEFKPDTPVENNEVEVPLETGNEPVEVNKDEVI
jgi:hypothetical protein